MLNLLFRHWQDADQPARSRPVIAKYSYNSYNFHGKIFRQPAFHSITTLEISQSDKKTLKNH